VRSRAGYGLDTCHLYASGYDITESESALRGLLDTFEKATGEAPSFFHLNDSGGELGSNRDRHALIGEGCIGIEPFRWLLRDPRTRDVPLIFETPDARTEVARDDPTPDPNEVAMLTLLRSLLPET
jgi:endonuclease IV